ncbi:hypothetical protein P7K49_025635 [Saguinus oedipus]|uniref:Uncharacterized protein n=1 Tax=Saguinus oedipus TaxID=9490 RepID=A0ABQ9UHT0_SAGOE|nr:hypothetical protein P7K49_025635 [Saguinus oedipus]
MESEREATGRLRSPNIAKETEKALGPWEALGEEGMPQGPCSGSGGALGNPTPPPKYTRIPLHEGYSLTTSVSIRLLPGLGDDMVSPPPLSLPRPVSRGRAGSSVEVATPSRSRRSRQPPPPPPPARGNTGHCPAEWGWGPRGARLGLPLSGCGSAPARPRRSSAPRDAPSCLLCGSLACSPLTLWPTPSSLHYKRTTPAQSASLPQPRSGRRDVTSVTSSEGRAQCARGVGHRRGVDFPGGFWEL